MESSKVRSSRWIAIAACLLLSAFVGAMPAAHAGENAVRLDFEASPYADFLFYLLHRDNRNFPDLRASVPMDDVKTLNTGAFLPAYAMASDVRSYADLYKLAYTYDDSKVLIDTLKQGEWHFPAFMTYWRQQMEPREQATIASWKAEEAKGRHVERLEALTRMRFSYASVKVAVIALGPLGTNMQNPPIMFATMQDANLPAVIGYEGTHMMMSAHNADWKRRKNASQAIALISARGGTAYDIEEALSLLMAAKLPASYDEASDLPSHDEGDTPRRELLRAMERDWDRYHANTSMTAADFAIDETLRTFGAGGVAKNP
ncbi:hypothetical protein SAMN04487785_12111 [Dyella jiangningensis]|uniref:hypothetical protein n=1 Tax=Dyella sp. AtDHG13 TaxID=1938897 RepID=UPI000886DD29|nr:hypothetical protein [Dyella sp. AtDHG13]PXV53168.1 hypothetical protein BDW41_11660 [Dyella sp. AtDHG13]SDL44468.1 hypothetical protein SAMN04487785_12111 [Dyella jiangningensis]